MSGYTIEGLKDMVLQVHPEIVQHALNLSATYDKGKKAYVLTFSRGGRELKTFLNKEEAEQCMKGNRCVYLGVQIAEFIADFEKLASS